jgi:signal peptidase II
MLSLLLISLDQLTKLMVMQLLAPGDVWSITSNLNLVHVYNTGAAFSFLADAGGWQRWFFSGLALAVSGVLGVLVWRAPEQRLFAFASALVIGGALGNLIDRVTMGAVVDFVDLHAAGWHWPAFNLADSVIVLGAGLFILDELRRVKRAKPPRPDRA